jgi:hypothetical protein
MIINAGNKFNLILVCVLPTRLTPCAFRLPLILGSFWPFNPLKIELLLGPLQRAEKTLFDSIRRGKWILLSDGLKFYALRGGDTIDPSCRLARFSDARPDSNEAQI